VLAAFRIIAFVARDSELKVSFAQHESYVKHNATVKKITALSRLRAAMKKKTIAIIIE
jgi:hypothetical protein